MKQELQYFITTNNFSLEIFFISVALFYHLPLYLIRFSLILMTVTGKIDTDLLPQTFTSESADESISFKIENDGF